MARESCIQHQPKSRMVFVHADYLSIVSHPCDALVLSLFHQDLKPKTLWQIRDGILGFREERRLRHRLTSMRESGLLEVGCLEPFAIAEILQGKNLDGLGIGEKICQWCRISTVATQKHHFPVPASKGGVKTISICATCHFEFHQIAEIPLFKPTARLVEFFAQLGPVEVA